MITLKKITMVDMHQSSQSKLDVSDTSIKGSASLPIDSSFPEEEVNALSQVEAFNKHLYRPNTYMHKWWARRSGTTFRSILKQLVTDPSHAGYYSPGGLEGKIILDPMMGGGTTLHEAIRMGANVIGIDVDPIPVLQARATLTGIPLDHKKKVFDSFFEELSNVISPLYVTSCPTCGKSSEIQYTLYGIRKKCRCHEIVMADNLILRHEKERTVRICPSCHEIVSDDGHECRREAKTRMYDRDTDICESCGEKFEDCLQYPFSQRYAPVAIVGLCGKHGQFFKRPNGDEEEHLDEASRRLGSLGFGRCKEVIAGPKSDDLIAHEVHYYEDLFTPRQLLYIEEARRIMARYEPKDRLWLALLISTSLEFNSLLCGYKGSDIRRPGAIRHVFSHHAYTFPHTALENNPTFSQTTSGSLQRLFQDRIAKASEWAMKPLEVKVSGGKRKKVSIAGEVDQGVEVSDWKGLTSGTRRFMLLHADAGSVSIPPGLVDFVVTDPPYYDSVQYGDLSNFFRVWLEVLFPEYANWSYDVSKAAVASNGNANKDWYEEAMTRIWQTCHSALKPETGRLIFTYHHWRPEAWASLTNSLKGAKFSLVNHYVVFAENPISVHIKGLKALSHDSVLVLRPKKPGEAGRVWEEPQSIDRSSSYSFCRDCGFTLGWLLNSDYNSDEVLTQWKLKIGVDNGGKLSRGDLR